MRDVDQPRNNEHKVATADLHLMKIGNSQNQSAFIPSLLIKDKPHQSLVLLMHLKKFSEMLFAWGQSSKAILISKIIYRSYSLYETIQNTCIELDQDQRDAKVQERLAWVGPDPHQPHPLSK